MLTEHSGGARRGKMEGGLQAVWPTETTPWHGNVRLPEAAFSTSPPTAFPGNSLATRREHRRIRAARAAHSGARPLALSPPRSYVFGDFVVEEAILARNVADLRKALGDDPDAPRYIETLPKRGCGGSGLPRR